MWLAPIRLSSHALTLERRSAIEVPLWTSSTLYVVCRSLARSEFASRRKKRVSLMRRCHFSGIRTCLAEGPYCAAVGTRPWSIRLPSRCCSEQAVRRPSPPRCAPAAPCGSRRAQRAGAAGAGLCRRRAAARLLAGVVEVLVIGDRSARRLGHGGIVDRSAAARSAVSARRPIQQSSATWQWPRVMCSWSRAAQVPDRISDPQILDSFRFPGFPQQRSLSGGKQRRNSASSEEAPAAQLPRPGGVGCCVEKTAALSDLKTCTTSGICDSVLDSSVALPDALALSRGSPV